MEIEQETVQETEQETEQETPETYPSEVVKDLRKENAKYRTKAREFETKIEELTKQLFRMRVEATGKLADPDDLPYDPDVDINSAIEDLIARKPHLAARKISGDVGQGKLDKPAAPQDFSSLFRLS